jgi:hypothetical protein
MPVKSKCARYDFDLLQLVRHIPSHPILSHLILTLHHRFASHLLNHLTLSLFVLASPSNFSTLPPVLFLYFSPLFPFNSYHVILSFSIRFIPFLFYSTLFYPTLFCQERTVQRSALKEHISKLMTEGGQGAGGMFAQLMGKRGKAREGKGREELQRRIGVGLGRWSSLSPSLLLLSSCCSLTISPGKVFSQWKVILISSQYS